MKKLSIAAFLPIALTVPPIPVHAQAQALPAAVAACYAAPAVCAVVGATAAGWIIVKYGEKQFCTWSGCTPSRQQRSPQEFRQQSEIQTMDYGVTKPDRCQNILNRLRRAGYTARLIRARRNNVGTGGVLTWVCEIETNAPSNFYPSFGGQE